MDVVPTSPQDELAALSQIFETLDPMDCATRNRILDWLKARFEHDHKVAVAPCEECERRSYEAEQDAPWN